MAAPLLTRDELLGHLRDAFVRYGYEGASMSRIAAATGLGKASLYHHFPGGKEQMASAVLESVRDWYEQNVFRPMEAAHPPRQRLVTMLETLKRVSESGRVACLPGLFALTEEREMFGEAISGFFLRWLVCMTQLLNDAGLARDIAKRRAHDAVERIQGVMIIGRTFGDGQAFNTMMADLPDQLLAGGDRSNIWTSRVPRFPAAPSAAAAHAHPLR